MESYGETIAHKQSTECSNEEVKIKTQIQSIEDTKVDENLDSLRDPNSSSKSEKGNIMEVTEPKLSPDILCPELINDAQLYESGLNPTYEFYLNKTKEVPEHIFESKYLSENLFEKVTIASYGRSGNTLIRKYIEDITGIVTGSDTDFGDKLRLALLDEGMKGEGKIDSKVWCVKTHFPMRST